MKLFLSILIAVSFTSCNRLDIFLSKENNRKPCDVAKQELLYSSDSMTVTFHKTYSNGKVKTLYAILPGAFGAIDTLEYTFTYLGNNIAIKEKAKGLRSYVNPYEPTEAYFKAYFNPDGFVTKIGDEEFKYASGRLVKAAGYSLTYDNNRNLEQIRNFETPTFAISYSLGYEYDLAIQAKGTEFFNIVGVNFGRNFCLSYIMGWIPTLSKNTRKREILKLGNSESETIVQEFDYSDFKYNGLGQLLSFKRNNETVKNYWQCP